MSRHVTDAAIMRIHLIVRINRRANDTFKSPFAFFFFSPERVELEGPGELSPSVNMCDINMYMLNCSRSGAGFIILALAQSAGAFEVQVKLWKVWNRPNSVGTGGFTSREEAN